MNTPVNFETKQLLFNKGWKYELGFDETGHRVKNSLAEQRWNEGDLTYVDITISEVVMWLYKKHEIWIQVKPGGKIESWDFIIQIKDNDFARPYFKIKQHKPFFNSPTEAYEAAIEYTLNNLI